MFKVNNRNNRTRCEICSKLTINAGWVLSFIRPVQNNIFNIFDPIGLKFLTHLRLGFSRLNERRFRHNFQDCMNLLRSCSLEIEDTLHYLLDCHHFNHIRIDLKKV